MFDQQAVLAGGRADPHRVGRVHGGGRVGGGHHAAVGSSEVGSTFTIAIAHGHDSGVDVARPLQGAERARVRPSDEAAADDGDP